jgi:8-oxo-dGTP diphosphatase
MMDEEAIAGRPRKHCPACGHVLYENPVPGAGVLVEMGNGIVLVQRGQPPFEGWWALPSGYIEADESVEQAAIRECKEETGLDVTLVELFGVYSFPEGPVQSGIVIFYRARPTGGQLRAGDDAKDVGVFARDSLPEPLAFRTHREVLERWVSQQATGRTTRVPDVVIRAAEVDDEDRVLELMTFTCDHPEHNCPDREAASRRFRESLTTHILVADLNREVVGFLVLAFYTALSGPRAVIDTVAVDPAHRRQGIGGALVEAAVREAHRRDVTHLLVDTSRGDTSAREFYSACGLEVGEIATLRFR